jgi:DNA repair photolyase
LKFINRYSKFIRQFSGPGENNIICFKFWQAIIASGCPGECSYCFLQTQHPYRNGNYFLKGTLFKNLIDVVSETKIWLKNKKSAGLIIGENQDGLAFEKPYKKLLGFTPLEILFPLFIENNPYGHLLIILSKFISTQYIEKFGPSNNILFSWSLSFPTISKKYEKKVTPIETRIKKAERLKEKGYRIRLRLDALAPIPNWKKELNQIVKYINDIEPEMLTVGSLRASNKESLKIACEINGRNSSILQYLEEKDPSNFKYRTNNNFQIECFQLIKDKLSSSIKFALCKEDKSVWKQINAKWQGCNCLHYTNDVIAIERMKNRRLKFSKFS